MINADCTVFTKIKGFSLDHTFNKDSIISPLIYLLNDKKIKKENKEENKKATEHPTVK